MKIQVSRVPKEGLQRHQVYNPLVMDMDRDDIRLREPFEVDADISLVNRELMVKITIDSAAQCTCARCLDEFRFPITTGTLLNYEVREADTVDITDDVRQEIILAFPDIALCRPDCKGLCPACGKNRNVAICEHSCEYQADS